MTSGFGIAVTSRIQYELQRNFMTEECLLNLLVYGYGVDREDAQKQINDCKMRQVESALDGRYNPYF